MVSDWPVWQENLCFPQDEQGFTDLVELIKAIRAVRAEMGVHPARKTSLFIQTGEPEAFETGRSYLEKFAAASEIEIGAAFRGDAAACVQVVTDKARAFIPMMELVDREKELARLQKELAGCEKEIAAASAKLNNQGFVSKAPAQVVEGVRNQLARAEDKKAHIKASIKALG